MITPLYDRVVIRRLDEAETKKSLIFIPDSAKEKPQEGEVVAVGEGRLENGKHVPLLLKVGDKVLFGKYSGNDIKVDDVDYLIMPETEVLAKV